MKIKGHGQAGVLSTAQLQRLFEEGFTSARDRCLFAICLFTGCRISEALALRIDDIQYNTITLRKNTTKGRLSTRQMVIHPNLLPFIEAYEPRNPKSNGALFPGRGGVGYLSRFSAHQILTEACERIGVRGVSTHSFRRTALTQMSNAGVPLKHIQEISGHRDLGTLQRYLEVSEEQKEKAVRAISLW